MDLSTTYLGISITSGTVPKTVGRFFAAHSSASSPIADEGVIG